MTPGGAKRSFKKRKTLKGARKPKGIPEMYAKAQVFPDVLNTTLRYNSNMTRINPAAASTFVQFNPMGMFDFDIDNVVGNKQPLYFDELLTVDGPYKNYLVKSWNTKIEIINKSPEPLMAYWAQINQIAEADTLIEVQNRSNVRELILTHNGGDNDSGVIKAPGKITDIYGTRVNVGDQSGNQTSNPAIPILGVLYLYNPGGVITTPVDCWIKITHDFHVELNTADSIIS